MRTTTQFNNNVEWKRFGLFLKTTPHSNQQGHLRIEVDLEISSLEHMDNGSGVPALNRSQVKTQVNMERPRPIFISGFLQQNQGKSRSGLPWLQQIPLFSPLFSSGQIYNDDFELVFILVPQFYESRS